MRIAFFGLSLTSSWGNGHAGTYRALLRALHRRGHEVLFFERDVEWYAANRDLPHPDFARLRLYADWNEIESEVRRLTHDADALVAGSYFPDAVRLLDLCLGAGGARVCFYDMDTPETLQKLDRNACAYLRPDQIPALDLYLSFTGGPLLLELESRWQARCARPLYCTCDESRYLPAAPARNGFALSYMGTYAPDRQSKLRRLLLEPARRLTQRRFQVAGPLYPDVASWPGNVGYTIHLPPGLHPGFYTAGGFCLNLTRQAMVEAGYSPSVRLFEAAACGAAILTDPWPGLEEFFQPGHEILIVSESAEVVRAIEDFTPGEIRALGQAARARVLAEHSSGRRAEHLETLLQAAPLACPN